ncbi:MAG: hypothetical protein HYU69_15020 [Bacteroidetes bacterium]|nr:hypothetical protein [Bacteroidota bacterium]
MSIVPLKSIRILVGLLVFGVFYNLPASAIVSHNDSTCHNKNCHQWHITKTFYEDGKIKSIKRGKHPRGSHCDVTDGICKTRQIEKSFYSNGKLKEYKELKISGSGWTEVKSRSVLKQYGFSGRLIREVKKLNGKTVYERNY